MSADTRTSASDREILEAVRDAAASIFPQPAEWSVGVKYSAESGEAFIRAVYTGALGNKVSVFPATCSVGGIGYLNYVNARSIATLCQHALTVARIAERALNLEALIASCADDLYGTLVGITSVPSADFLKLYNVARDTERRLRAALPPNPSPALSASSSPAVAESASVSNSATPPEPGFSVEGQSSVVPSSTDLSLGEGEPESAQGLPAHLMLPCAQTVNRFGYPLGGCDPGIDGYFHQIKTHCGGHLELCSHHEYLAPSSLRESDEQIAARIVRKHLEANGSTAETIATDTRIFFEALCLEAIREGRK